MKDTTFERYTVTNRSAKEAKAVKPGDPEKWYRCGEFKTRDEALAYIVKAKTTSRSMAAFVEQEKMQYRIQLRRITILTEEIL